MTDDQKRIFTDIASHTAPLCAGKGPGACRVPHSCCDRMYCEDAIRLGKESGEDLQPVAHNPLLPLMGPRGCIAPAHLRPICSVHVCCINSAGANVHDSAWTARYFELRDQVEEILAGLT